MRPSSNLISDNESRHVEFYSGELLYALWGKGLLYAKRYQSKGQEPFLATNHTKKQILGQNWHYRLFLRILGYTFYTDGTGRLKWWDWLDQKYVYQKYKWSATDDVISFDMEELPDWGAGGSSIRYYTVTPTSLTLYYSDGDLDGVYTKE